MDAMAARIAATKKRPHAPVPLLDLRREFHAIREEVMQAIEEVCEANHFVLGPPVERFEKAAAAFCQVPAALGCGNGSDALWLALAALGLGTGDCVVTTPFSFFATASAILRTGATPIFADIDPGTLNLSAHATAEVLARLPDNTRHVALLPVHLYGQCADMDAFDALARERQMCVVEDAAQAFGAFWKGRPAGSLGDAAAFSFYPTKNLSAFGDAGMVTFADPVPAERARALRNHGMRRRYFHEELEGHLGANSRLDGIQAAVLSVKLGRLPTGNQRRRELAARYNQLFVTAGLTGTNTHEGIVLPFVDPRAESCVHQYVIRAPRRDELRSYLAEQGIGSEVYYPLPLHLQKSLSFLGYGKGDFPVAELAADEVLALPIFPELREDEVEAVVEAVARFYA